MNKPMWGSKKDFPDTEPLLRPGEEAGYADTAPQPLTSVPAARTLDLASLELAPVEFTLYDAMMEIRKDNRVCPLPTRWLEFFRVLEQAGGSAALPPQPLVGSAWAATPASAKRMCFNEQVEWAEKHGCLKLAMDFLNTLGRADWNYS